MPIARHECPGGHFAGGTTMPTTPGRGGQQKTFLPFGHGSDLAAFNGPGLQNKSFQDRADKKGLNPFGTRKTTRASGPIHLRSVRSTLAQLVLHVPKGFNHTEIDRSLINRVLNQSNILKPMYLHRSHFRMLTDSN